MKNIFAEVHLKEWRDIFSINRSFLSTFIFRGQSSSAWQLESSLERSIKEFYVIDRERDISKFGIYTQEKWMIDRFQRKYPLYSTSIPARENYFDWLAIMQHYGAPTRLLDFTYSLFVAVYFALIDAKGDASIWAVNLRKVAMNMSYKLAIDVTELLMDQLNEKYIEVATKYIGVDIEAQSKIAGVIPLEPLAYSQRLSRQQGLFLMHTITTKSFMSNLLATFDEEELVFQPLDVQSLANISQEQGRNSDIGIFKIVFQRTFILKCWRI